MPNGRYVLGDPVLGKRILVGVATNQLADQWGDRLLGEMNEETGIREPSIFGDRFTEETVGVYHADMPEKDKEAVLSKPIVIIVHDSSSSLYYSIDPQTNKHAPRLRPEEFDLVLIDEIDDRVRGDVTREFYQDKFFPNCMIIGCTATHRFRSGKTVGEYIFNGQQPICEILHEDAVQKREIAPHINIIVEPEIDPISSEPVSLTDGWSDYSDAQQLRFINQAGTDEALLETIRVGHHPKTGKPLQEMMQLHKAVNIGHAKELAERYNQEFGNGYAEAIWGGTDDEMNDDVRRLAMHMLRNGQIKMIVQCKIWGRGTDIPPLELTTQHAPMLSPNELVQFHTRASRINGRDISLYLSPFVRGIDQLVIGELLGGLYKIPPGYEFPATAGSGAEPSEAKQWPHIEGVNVHYTQQHLEMFAQRRRQDKNIADLEKKSRRMLTLDEMADSLQIDRKILYRRVYLPLEEAYKTKQTRQQFLDLSSSLHVRGKIFPTRRIGIYQHKGQEEFCVDKDLTTLCEHTLYGRLNKTPAEVLDKDTARRLLECSSLEIQILWRELQHAFFDRKNYERQTKIEGVSFTYDSFGFFIRQSTGTSEMFISPDALIPAYRRLKGVSLEEAQLWAQKPAIRQCKTSDWYTKADVMEALDLNSLAGSRDALFVEEVFQNLDRKSRKIRMGNEAELSIIIDRSRQTLKCSKKWLPMEAPSQQNALVVDKKAFQWIKSNLDTESAYEARNTFYGSRRGSRKGPKMAP
jgi:superfamily II DNA or RNA helicase